MVVMATNGTGAFAPVLAAMATMRDGQREQKKAAHEFLESFQKSVGGRCRALPVDVLLSSP